jgi:YodL-like protein
MREGRTMRYSYYVNTDAFTWDDEKGFIQKKELVHIPGLEGYFDGDELAFAYEGNIDYNMSENEQISLRRVCDQLFQLFNAPWERPDEYAGPSMSVGDIVCLRSPAAVIGEGNTFFAVEMTGFKQIDGFGKSKISPRPSAWIRSGADLDSYLKAKEDDLRETASRRRN